MRAFLFFLLLFQMHIAQSQVGELRGIVVDENNEPLPFVRVILFTSGEEAKFVAGVQADFDGKFRLIPIVPGSYDVQLSDYSLGYDTLRLTGVNVYVDQITLLDSIEMKPIINYVDGCICLPPVYEKIRPNIDTFGRSIKIESEDIRRD